MVLKLDGFAPDERKSFDGDVEEVLSSDEYRHQIKRNLKAHGNVESLEQAPLIVEMLSSDEYKRQIKSNLAAHGNVESLDEAPLIPVADDYNKSVGHNVGATAEAREVIMDRRVQSILNLRETVAQAANKVKHLGESSQQISKVAFLINQIALQTNMLAINASIEATRASEDSRGFAVVAEQVGQLAAKSSGATKEIEQIVENIQLEISELVRAMELEMTEVIEEVLLLKLFEDKRSC